MNNEQFAYLLADRLDKIKNVLGLKAQEYAINGERLHNFKEAARCKNETVEEALWGMFIKHYVSVQDMVYGRTKPTSYLVNEKIGDCINYLILLEAAFTEQLENETDEIRE